MRDSCAESDRPPSDPKNTNTLVQPQAQLIHLTFTIEVTQEGLTCSQPIQENSWDIRSTEKQLRNSVIQEQS